MLFSSPVFAAGTPTILSFQGRLADSSGNLLGGNGTNYYFKFSIWDNTTVGAGTKLWPTSSPSSATSSVRQGVFNVNIGDTAAGYPDVLDYNFSTATDIYLQIEVSSDNVTFQTLSPRQRITAAAFARVSGAVSGADTPSSFGTTTPFASTQVSVEATSTNSILLGLRARASQIANLFQIQNSAGGTLFSVGATGGIFGASTLDISGTSTLASTTASLLNVTGAVNASSTVNVTGQTTLFNTLNLAANAAPTTDVSRSLGTNALRFLNLFSQNIFASSSVVTNASSTALTLGTGSSAAGKLFFANASNNFTTQLISSSTQASNLTFTLPGATGTPGQVLTTDGSGGMYFSTASGGITGGTNGFLALWTSASTLSTGLFADNGVVAGINATSSSYTFNVQGSGGVNPFNVASSSGATLFSILANGRVGIGTTTPGSLLSVQGSSYLGGDVIATGTLSLTGALNASSTVNITGVTTHYNTTNVAGDILATTDVSRSLGTNALRFLNLFSQNIFASSSVVTNSSTTVGTINNLFATNATATDIFSATLRGNSAVIGNATGTNLFATNAVVAPTFTGTGAVSITSTNAGGLTLDSSSGRVTFGTGDFLKTGVSGVSGAAAGDLWYDTSDSKYKINEGGSTKILCNMTDTGCGAGGSGVSLAPSSAQTDSSASSSIFINKTQTTGNLLQLQQAGLDKLTISNSGGLSIFTATTDIIKTSTGTTRTQDFSVSGSTLQNVTSTDNLISINNGTITLEGSIAASSPAVTTSGSMGLGGQVILRDDGKYIVIHGGASTGVSLWDGSTTGAMSAAPTALTNAAGAGAIALKRPDGRYLVVSGNGSAGLTTLYDPYGITASASGAVVCAAGAATTGTNAILLPNGNYLIMCGGLAVTSIYNPTSNVVTVGPPLPTGTFGVGSHALARDDGTFLIFKGNGTGTAIYNPLNSGTGVTTIGTMTDVTITNAPTIAIGATSIRKQDGTYLVIPGAITTSAIYDPKGTTASPNGTFTTQSGAGNGPSAALGEGAQAFWRQDGNYLLILGGSTVTTTNVIKPGAASGSQFVTTNAPALSSGGAGVGITAFMMPDGRYAILKGNGTAMDYYDMGFVVGGLSTGTGSQSAYYESECIDTANLNPNSVINWTSNTEGTIVVEERTVTSASACSTGTYGTSSKSGDLVNPAASTDNRIQFRVTFKRELPKFFDQEWGVRKSGMTRYRRTNKDPALYDIGVANGLALHRTQFDFGDSTATSGPVSINISNNKDKNLGIALEAGIGYGSTVGTVAGSGGIYNGAFNSSPALTTTASNGTIVMKRPDGKFVVISGNTGSANAQLYNPELRTFSALGVAPAVGTGLGALAFKRPDGKFLIVIGNNTTTTSIYDPVANTFTAGPALTGLAGDGAQVIPLPNGRVLIIHGNYLSTTSIYDPIQNIMIGGPAPSTVVGQGSIVIPRPDGTFLFIPGTITTTCTALNTVTNIFDPYTMTFGAQSAVSILGTGPGAFAFQRNDGLWVIVRGGSTITTCAGLNATTIYNPVSNRAAVGPTLSAAAQRGAHAIPRPDGTWLIVHASSTNTTSIYRESAGAFTAEAGGPIGVFVAGPTLITSAGAGAISFQKDNGKFVTLTGNAGSVVHEYDGGWVDKGVYKTEQFNLGTQLGTDSTLTWRSNSFNGLSAEVKSATTQAGLQTASTRDVAKSGGLINGGASDTWLQLNFNFVRKFPSYGTIYTDTWYNSGASISYAIRKIETPTLYEYKVTKDKDVIDLQSDGLSIFRVSSSGDVYTQAGSTINTSGADLAERYTSQEQLDFGEVVTIDAQNNHGVKRSMYQYQPDVLGVVSTDPGFVAGAYTKDSYPIALVGRVPVKVSTENGMIRSGDFLTVSSVPGHAMKATLAGRVIGKALETLDESALTDCPPSDFVIPGRKCGTVMMFVNLIDYNGIGIEVALADWKANKEKLALDAGVVGLDFSETTLETPGIDDGSQFVFKNNHSAEILTFLEALKKERAAGVNSQSEIFAERISVIGEIISPKIIAGILEAREGSFANIEGLTLSVKNITTETITTEKIESRYGGLTFAFTENGRFVLRKIKGLAADTSTAASSSTEGFLDNSSSSTEIIFSDTASTTDVVVTFDDMGNASFAGTVIADKISTGGLDVTGKAVFQGGLEVSVLGTASTTLNMLSDTFFFGRPYFTSDTGGTAIIKKGAKLVDIVFEREYIEHPIVTTSLVFTASTTNETIEKLFADDIRFIVVNRTTKGFSIYLNKETEEDIVFNWVALAVKDSKEFTSKVKETDEEGSHPLDTGTSTVDVPFLQAEENADQGIEEETEGEEVLENETTEPVTETVDEPLEESISSDESDSATGISVPSF